MEWVENAIIRSSIDAPEVVRRDVNRVILGENVMVMLTTMTKQIRNKYSCNSSDKVKLSDHVDVKETVSKLLRQRTTTGNSNMAAQTGSTYICGTTIDSVEIPLFLFPVVGIIWGTLSLNSPWSKTLDWLLNPTYLLF